MLPVLHANRYVVPLREGGSLPAVLDTDAGLYVAKFRGAGQGALALVAEIVVGELARVLSLRVPALALIEVDEHFGRSERDWEIQELLRRSQGINVGLRYLESAFAFDPGADTIDAEHAATIVWLDALVSNVDRTARNTNLLWWRDEVWLIDHGSSLVFHHDWPSLTAERTRAPFTLAAGHVLLRGAGGCLRDGERLARLDAALAARLGEEVVREVLAMVPDQLLLDAPPGVVPPFPTAEQNREAYWRYFAARLAPPRAFAADLRAAAESAASAATPQLGYRR